MASAFKLRDIEEKWIKLWEEHRIFEADPDSRPKVFVTFPFPYMNGPLHLGHAFTALRVDVYARFKRMQGYNVLFPWAWHWTGATIAGAAKRIEQGDEKLIKVLVEIDGVSPDEIKKFVDPVYMARYYTNENRKVVKRIGFSVDWRREFHTTNYHPAFNRFISWQYLKLREKGFVVKGTHPIVWCPRCKSPTGDHDRLEGVGVGPERYVLMKFKIGETYLPAATFRPETIYGVTNFWINPDATYVLAQVNGEKWIISEPAARKLSEQLKKIKIIKKILGRELVGRTCKDPINGREILILPAPFVDPENGTGLVYSVPAHAPYDWLALRDLLENPSILQKYGIPVEKVKEIKPISIITVEGFGDFPAIEIVDQLNIKSQLDSKAEEATQIIYKKEFHKGILKENCGEYAGLKVFEVKERLIQDFIAKGYADLMYDLTRPVICRCGTKCVVKVLEDQWFLKYSDPNWKALAKKALSGMKIFPPEARKSFEEVIDWLEDKPCARFSGLGTPLPWDPNWLVETLSDSTIYMAFYTISKYVNEGLISPENLTNEVFDYVFLGIGDPDETSKKSGIPKGILEKMRNEFNYWYPIDLRVSAKELLPNHLTFYIFHHVAIFPEHLWPKAIGVNGMLMIEGQPMSKSKGIFVTLKDAIKNYGADTIRATLLFSAEDLDDPDWRSKNANDMRKNLESLYRFILNIYSTAIKCEEKPLTDIDKWLLSQIQRIIIKVVDNLNVLKTRTAFHEAFFGFWNAFKWYLRRVESVNKKAVLEAIDTWLRLLAPFIPFTCEELWEKTGHNPFVSIAKWPEIDESKISPEIELSESLIRKTLSDILEIIRVIKVKPSRIVLYVAPDWKWRVYVDVAKLMGREISDIKEITREIMRRDYVKGRERDTIKVIKYSYEDLINLSKDERVARANIKIDELKVFLDAAKFLEKETGAKVTVFRADDPARIDPKSRAQHAMPLRPAIYIE
ncbi:MAG: leucine--tRNA ligase [archaeon GB-1867-005]|nr:leucine--tRNA ligase [Candidatus Culexmicrobium cathedralense]